MKRLTFSILSLLASVAALAWAPAGNNIRTSWADQVDPANTLPEYPRPQMVRADWQNLNGLWQYGITKASEGTFTAEGEILVPFAVESSLSGVGRSVMPDDALWYERTFTVPTKWKGRNVLLHFGAVDWKAEVWVNGTKVGEHTGGYAPFSFDITAALKKKGKQTLRVKVQDSSDQSFQPRGKQWLNPCSIWYTPVTGIWQTVWIEPVAKTYVAGYQPSSDIDKGTISLAIDACGLQDGDIVRSEILDGGNVVATAEGADVCAQIPSPKFWSPDSPNLYDIRISIIRGGKVVDKVDGYTAMRKISVMKDASPNRYNRLALNNRILFQYGPLDQGWWPDGLYTAPTDEALRYDIERTKAWGFNMIRKHIKVEPARWYWWCDKLGIIVWQDMPCIADHANKAGAHRSEDVVKMQTNVWSSDTFTKGTDCVVPQEWKDNYYKEWSEIVSCLKGFQCIGVWIPFNEAWGQFDTKEVVAFTRKLDPSRLVNPSSGGNFDGLKQGGDIIDVHHYPCPAMNAFDRAFVNVLGEYGGIGYPVEGHLWKISDKNWGYGGVKSSGEEVLAQYRDFATMLKVFVQTGCSAAVYTQTTDVEIEVNGLMTYDRKVIKVDEAAISEINKRVIRSLSTVSFPVVRQNGKIAIVAHRGFWNCEKSGKSQNSIASLATAQENGLWGSECDIHLTGDGKIIVNHDPSIDGLKISETDFETLASHLLPNGQRRPSLDEYLAQTAKGVNKTRLVIELKIQPTQEAEDALVAGTIEALKAHKLWSPDKVAFISFSHHICLEIARRAPAFINQYLEGDIAPDKLAEEGINGIDYHYDVFYKHPEWVAMAHELGMSVNSWTVNKPADMDYIISLGVDAITTNEPLLLREKLGERELRR